MTITLNAKRREVLTRISDVYGDRLYENMSKSRSVAAEVGYLLKHELIEPCERDGEPGYRRTDEGAQALTDN